MLTATRKHHYVVEGLSRFAQVTIGQPEPQDANTPPQPQIILNGGTTGCLTDEDRMVVESAAQGVRQAEVDMQWRKFHHCVLNIEGLLVDGIDPESARIAAYAATKALIQT